MRKSQENNTVIAEVPLDVVLATMANHPERAPILAAQLLSITGTIGPIRNVKLKIELDQDSRIVSIPNIKAKP